MIKHLLILFFCQMTLVTFGQEIGTTFKVGLNFPQFLGPVEKGTDGSELESFSTFTGFHVSGGVVFKLLDHYGLRAELMYNQKGSRYYYKGPATYIFTTSQSGSYVHAAGEMTITNRINNSYLELPITGYMKYRKFELNLGASFGLLVSSNGVGDFQFNGTSSIANQAVEISSNILHNYRKDDLETTAEILTFDPVYYKEIEVDGETIYLLTDETAYAQYTDVGGGVYGTADTKLDEKFYKGIDVSLQAGVSYYVRSGLFLGFTAQYGLLDVSNDYFNYTKSTSTGLVREPRKDFDRNFNMMVSIGFSF